MTATDRKGNRSRSVSRGGGGYSHNLYGYVPPNGVVILTLLI